MSSFHVHIPLSFHDVILNSLGYVFKEFLKKKLENNVIIC